MPAVATPSAAMASLLSALFVHPLSTYALAALAARMVVVSSSLLRPTSASTTDATSVSPSLTDATLLAAAAPEG